MKPATSARWDGKCCGCASSPCDPLRAWLPGDQRLVAPDEIPGIFAPPAQLLHRAAGGGGNLITQLFCQHLHLTPLADFCVSARRGITGFGQTENLADVVFTLERA